MKFKIGIHGKTITVKADVNNDNKDDVVVEFNAGKISIEAGLVLLVLELLGYTQYIPFIG
jgi:hypothetical protein